MPYPALTNRDDLLKILLDMTYVRKLILDQCERLTSDQLNDTVYPGTWSILKNLAHLAFAELYMLAFIKSRPDPAPIESYPTEPPLDLHPIRIALDEAHAETISFLKANPESVLTEKCVVGRNQEEVTVGGLYFHIIQHEIGHRAFILHKLKKLLGK
jgi:uncharacterized damage-inducible protein DinB